MTNSDVPLVRAEYEDEAGLWWVVMVPEGREQAAHMGIPVGPPDLSTLELPPEVAARLHNELFRRGLLTKRDLRGRGMEVFAALQAAYKVDTTAVTTLYQ